MASAAQKRAKRKAAREAMRAAGIEPMKPGPKRKDATGSLHGDRVADRIETALKARMMQYKLTKEQAQSRLSGSVIGRLRLRGQISQAEMEAGENYGLDMARYYALTGIPYPSAKAHDLAKQKGFGRDPSEDAVKAAANKVMKLEGVIGRVDRQGRPVRTLVRRVCIEDCEDGIHWPHMIKHLKRGLREMALYYGIKEMEEAA